MSAQLARAARLIAGSRRNYRVLLVDDNDDDRLLIRRWLRQCSYQVDVTEADTGKAAIAAYAPDRFDAVLLDTHLPDRDGIDILREILSDHDLSATVIAMTGLDSEAIAIEMLSAGAVDFIHKEDMTPVLLDRSLRYAQVRWKSESKFRSMVVGSADPILVVDQANVVQYANPQVETIFDSRNNEVIGRKLDDLVRKGRFSEMEVVRSDGKTVLLEARIAELEWNSQPCRIMTLRDVTERRKASERLHASEERYRLIVDTTNEGVCILNRDTTITFSNRRMAAMLGYPVSALIGRKIGDLGTDETKEIARRRVVSRMERKRIGDLFEIPFLHADGSTVLCQGVASVNYDEHDEFVGVLLMFTDVTEKRRAEEQLRQTMKMEALGSFASGIAHDLNNLLVPIIGLTELARDQMTEELPRKQLDAVMTAGNRAKALIDQILDFTRAKERTRKPHDIGRVVRSAIELVRTVVPSSIVLETEIDERAPMVLLDETEIHQIVLNLASNAEQAMEGTGTLAIRLRPAAVEKGRMSRSSVPSGRPGVILSISDTGCGMNAKTVEQIFDPFFTTKEVGKGTGLGLSVVHGIMEHYGGTPRVISEIGKGTMFELFFAEWDGREIDTRIAVGA
jgi:PAS domain S-box-containing protein